ncbi:MAG: DUF2235 domain-containing protein [Pseudomonadota bacterium]
MTKNASQTRPSTRTHVYIVDGTLSSLTEGRETNAGRLYRLLSELGPSVAQTLAYDPGVQGRGWRRYLCAASGMGINESILQGYRIIASRYRPGDRILLFGYSRGAYAVRSLAGLIDRIGLLAPEKATERRVLRAFRYYELDEVTPGAREFRRRHCHADVDIEMIGAWDTVKALGLPWPVLSWIAPPFATEFHDHGLGPHIKAGYHALALDEDRRSFDPILWERVEGWRGRLEQVWFPGGHGDVGGELGGYEAARPLANLSLVWMLEKALKHGLTLQENWRSRLKLNPCAPMIGARRGLGRAFVLRAPRVAASADGHQLHSSVRQREGLCPFPQAYTPRAALA